MSSYKRICMWSGPRNISTTLMYSFAQRTDTSVYDEPLYAYYLKNSNATDYHPGAEETLASQENDGEKVIAEMLSNTDNQVQFYKQMTHHLLSLDKSFLKKVTNILLTRDPKEMLPSYSAVIEKPQLNDVGYQLHIELVEYFEKNDIPYIVLDSKRVLLNPEEQLKKLCKLLGIEFQAKMLHWEKGARKEDGIWAKYWYKNIHNSTGFIPYKEKSEVFPKHLLPLLKECEPYYKHLLERAL